MSAEVRGAACVQLWTAYVRRWRCEHLRIHRTDGLVTDDILRDHGAVNGGCALALLLVPLTDFSDQLTLSCRWPLPLISQACTVIRLDLRGVNMQDCLVNLV
jgi:hypothetical protein